MAYAVASEVKAYSSLAVVAAVVDANLTSKYIPRAERLINSFCRQNFNLSQSKTVLVNGSGSTRQELSERLVTLTQLRFLETTDGGSTILSSTTITDVYNKGWWLEAGNEAVPLRRRVGKDYQNELLIFPEGSNNIEVIGTFGYSAVPAEVNEACCAIAEAIIAQEANAAAKTSGFRRESIGDYSYDKGDAGDGRWTMIPPDAKALLSSYVKPILMSAI